MEWWKVVNKNSHTGEIRIFGDIDSFEWLDSAISLKKFDDELQKLKNKKRVELRINSDGGEISEAIGMYNSFKRFAVENKVKTVTYIEGIAASSASFLALASDQVYMGKGTRFMIHNPTVGVRGTSKKLRETAERLDKYKNDIIDIYMTKVNISREEISNFMDEEKYFSVEEAIQYGFIDGETDLSQEELENNLKNFSGTKILNKLYPDLKLEKVDNNLNNKEEEEQDMVINDLKELKEKYGNLLLEHETEVRAKIEKEVTNKNEEILKNERERIKALDEITIGVNDAHRELIQNAKYKDPKTADQVTLAIVNSEAFKAHFVIGKGKAENKESGVDEIEEGNAEIDGEKDELWNRALNKVNSKKEDGEDE